MKMNKRPKNWKKEIQERYPFLRHKESTILNERGIECDYGWRSLLEELFQKLEIIAKKNNLPNFYLVQVKEKFSALRIYCENGNSEIQNLLNGYEDKSVQICELCGKPGKRKNFNGLIKTVCPTCEKGVIRKP